MKILIDTDRCTGYKTCVKVCPQMILEMVDEKAVVKDESICMGWMFAKLMVRNFGRFIPNPKMLKYMM